MSLLETIKQQSVEARKSGDKVRAGLLVTLYSEAAAVGKNNGNRESTDEEVTKIVRKFLGGVNETLKMVKSDAKFQIEKEVLESFLPPELTDKNIRTALDYVSAYQTLSMKSMPAIKAYIDEMWPNAYDGKRVSEMLKSMM